MRVVEDKVAELQVELSRAREMHEELQRKGEEQVNPHLLR